MWSKMGLFDQSVNQIMQKCQLVLELFRRTLWFPTQPLMSGIGFDKGEETLELVTLEMTNSK